MNLNNLLSFYCKCDTSNTYTGFSFDKVWYTVGTKYLYTVWRVTLCLQKSQDSVYEDGMTFLVWYSITFEFNV